MGKYVKKIFAGSSNPKLATKIAEECGVSLGELTIERFTDGEIWVKFEENLRGNDVYLVPVSYTHLTLPTTVRV